MKTFNYRCILFCIPILTVILLFAAGCSRESTFEPEAKTFRITSFTGEMISIPGSDEFHYTQTISWQGPYEQDVLYAISFEMSNDELDGYLFDPDGWLYFALPPEETIWDDRRSFSLSFTSRNGVLEHIITQVCVKYLYEGEESDPVCKTFSLNEIGTRIIMPWGRTDQIDDETSLIRNTGQGLKIRFEEDAEDIFLQGLKADSFNYRLNIISEDTAEVISSTDWYNTLESYDIREIVLNQNTDPPLLVNNPGQLTQIEAYMISNYTGIDNGPVARHFRVLDSFQPEALIYTRNTNLLGENHFTTFRHPGIEQEIPYNNTPGGRQYALPFFIDSAGDLAALYSEDLEIYFSWGWKGQYVNNDPGSGLINEVHDRYTGIHYHSEIVAFDLRLNGNPFPHSFYDNHPEYPDSFIHSDADGSQWLRIPVNDYVPANPPVTSEYLNPGTNNLQIRVIDNQMVISEVKTMNFHLQQRVPAGQKSGIIVVDNEDFPAMDDYIDNFYEEILENYTGVKERLDRRWIKDNLWDNHLHQGRNVIAPTDLESFRLIIWHCDDPLNVGANATNFHEDFDTLNLYMRGGGNILLSAGQNLKNIHQEAYSQPFDNFLLERYFGIPTIAFDAIRRLSSNYSTNYFFIGADRHPDTTLLLPDLDLYTGNNAFPLIQQFGAMGPVAYFDLGLITDPQVTPIYTMRTTPEGIEFAGEPVALRRESASNKTYLFGFPLSFMEVDQVRDMMDIIIADVFAN